MGGRHRPDLVVADLSCWASLLRYLSLVAGGRKLSRSLGSRDDDNGELLMALLLLFLSCRFAKVLFRRVLELCCVYILGLLFICLGSDAQWFLVSFQSFVDVGGGTGVYPKEMCFSCLITFIVQNNNKRSGMDFSHWKMAVLQCPWSACLGLVGVLTKSLSPWYGVWGLAQVGDGGLGVRIRSEGCRSKLRSRLRDTNTRMGFRFPSIVHAIQRPFSSSKDVPKGKQNEEICDPFINFKPAIIPRVAKSKLKKNSDSIIQWELLPFHAQKIHSLISFQD
ncbi:hypothetical protein F8388_024018 [Cannabis sativa]|uniref:Uncharacterized protein n=1 Tax=Cannabis sativa TaxID=3483 RepID=A0A7J6G030_CANSA|nr:hypothetical protein F8388_024018 [Cannabis sativa]